MVSPERPLGIGKELDELSKEVDAMNQRINGQKNGDLRLTTDLLEENQRLIERCEALIRELRKMRGDDHWGDGRF